MKSKNVPCLTLRYGEFGELRFGTSDDGITYFDATHYIQTKGDIRKHNTKSFEFGFTHWINAMCNAYDISKEDVIISEEKTGHILIDESLSLLFVSYIDPEFGVYMLERVSEMFVNGIVLSDTNLLTQLRRRFTKEVISKLIDDEE